MKNFADQLIESMKRKKSYLCVGLDPQLELFPPQILSAAWKKHQNGLLAVESAIVNFYRNFVIATLPDAAAFKSQIAFFEKYGHPGIRAYEKIISYIRSLSDIPIIGDVKREDGGDTSQAYADGHLGQVSVIGSGGELVSVMSPINVDAVTVTPWIDMPNFEPFKQQCLRNGKGMFIVDKTSFKPASVLQNAIVTTADGRQIPAWQHLTELVAAMSEGTYGKYGYSSIGVVMGATYPEEAVVMKKLLPRAIKLVPGYGAQQGAADDAVICINNDGFGAIINNSRALNYAWLKKYGGNGNGADYFNAAKMASDRCRNELNAAVKKSIGRLPWE